MFKKSDCFPKLVFLILLLFASSSLFAQKRITGKVINSDNREPVSGATVQIKGSTAGTQTIADGSFAISTTEVNANSHP